MDFNAIIDISSIVWDTQDYQNNKPEYYVIKNELLNLLFTLGDKRAKLFMRDELCLQMIQEFPFSTMPDDFRDFGTQIYYYLSGVGNNITSYPGTHNPLVSSNPNLIKPYYSQIIKDEISYLINNIHTPPNSHITYFTFDHFWSQNTALATIDKDMSMLHRTIVCREAVVKNLFELLKRKFDPGDENEKHHEGREAGDYASPLSCYKNGDKTLPEKYLELAIKEDDKCYYYDTINDVYVVFRYTRRELNSYHGHNETNLNNIPNTVRKHFNK